MIADELRRAIYIARADKMHEVMLRAADTIDRLEAENARLKQEILSILAQNIDAQQKLSKGIDGATESVNALWETMQAEVAQLTRERDDAVLLARAMYWGVAMCSAGNLWIGGHCYAYDIDFNNLPIITEETRKLLEDALKKAIETT